VDKSRNAEKGVGTEDGRVEKVVVNAAVDDIDRDKPRGGAHVDPGVTDDEIASLDDGNAHLACQEGMFEVGAVEDAGGEKDDIRLGGAAERGWGDILENFAEFRSVAVDRLHAGRAVEFGEGALEGGAVLKHVAGSRGTSEIVLQDEVVALTVADQIGAADMDVDVLGDVESHEFPAEMLRPENVVGRDDAILEDLLVMVDVVQEEIERGDALDEAFFHPLPFVAGNDSGDEIEGKDALGP